MTTTKEKANKQHGITEKAKRVSKNSTPVKHKIEKKKKTHKKRKISGRKQSSKHEQQLLPLSNFVLAISASDHSCHDADSKEESTKATTVSSYKHLRRLATSLGARVSGQVHGRITALVTTTTALKQATQRIRKAALKFSLPIIHFDWLIELKRRREEEKTEKENKEDDDSLVLMNQYRVDSSLVQGYISKQKQKKQRKEEEGYVAASSASESRNNNDVEFIDLNEQHGSVVDAVGWSEPQSLGCCCVCHELGNEQDCPWCVDCDQKATTITTNKGISG